ncbi:hypothetical protein IG631_07475 [Alternaria alternata]|nr:hypothetical protein IG631_07475 [Alternaria alternata]
MPGKAPEMACFTETAACDEIGRAADHIAYLQRGDPRQACSSTSPPTTPSAELLHPPSPRPPVPTARARAADQCRAIPLYLPSRPNLTRRHPETSLTCLPP